VTNAAGRQVQIPVRTPAHQSKINTASNSWISIPFTDAPSNYFTSSGQPYNARIPRGRITKIKSAVLVYTVAASSAVAFAPAVYHHSRIALYFGSQGTPAVTMDQDAIAFSTLSLLDNADYKSLAQNLGYSPDPKLMYSEGDTLSSSSSTTFFLPLAGCFPWQGAPFYVGDIKDDMVLQLSPAVTQVVLSGTNSNVTLSSMSLLINQDDASDEEKFMEKRVHQTVGHTWTYLEPLIVSSTQTLTAGSSLAYDISSLRHKVSHLVLLVRATGATNSSNGFWNLNHLGDEAAKLDVSDASGRSVLIPGTPLDARYIRYNVFSENFDSDLTKVRPYYMIPFLSAGSAKAAYGGVVSGFYEMSAEEKLNMNITPAASLQAEVQTITCSAAASAG
jgi:hypothetical protein